MFVLLYFAPLMFSCNYSYYSMEGTNNFYNTYKDEKDREYSTPECRVYHFTLMFATFILMQVVNLINSRKLGMRQFNVFENFFNNFWFIFVLVATTVATWAMIALGGKIFRLEPLPLNMFVTSILLALFGLVVGVCLKLVPEE